MHIGVDRGKNGGLIELRGLKSRANRLTLPERDEVTGIALVRGPCHRHDPSSHLTVQLIYLCLLGRH